MSQLRAPGPTGSRVVVVGAGLAGLVAAVEAADLGAHVTVLDQEPAASLGGQAFWSLGGLFLVDTPEQRRLGIRDDVELAWQDWTATAAFDRPEDFWPRRWARAYVEFAAGEARSWLRGGGMSLFPLVMWAERGGAGATGPGNSVPRFHLVWGTGPGVLRPFVARFLVHRRAGRLEFRPRHRVTAFTVRDGAVVGVQGEQLVADDAARGAPSSRAVTQEFTLTADAVVVASGGIGGNHDLVRRNWPGGPAAAPARLLSGVPDSTDGLLLAVAERAGARVVHPDRMWHYPEGLTNHAPVWRRHGIRVLSGPSPLWLDPSGTRLPAPLFPGSDTGGALRHLTGAGHEHSWLLLDEAVLAKEFGLSGSEQNPDLTGRSVRGLAARVRADGPPGPVQAFVDAGTDLVVADTLPELVAGMNALTGHQGVDLDRVTAEVTARDAQLRTGRGGPDSAFGKDGQLAAVRAARRYVGDRRMRVAPPHELLDGSGGRLVATRLSILTRKTLGGLETDLSARCLRPDGSAVDGLFAAGEAAGFGGGGMHGWRALEGSFLGGCLFSGRVAGRAAAGR